MADRLNRILTFLVWIAVSVFVMAAILPGRPFWFSPRKLLYFSIACMIAKSFWIWRARVHSKFLEIAPFLFLFLISLFGLSRFPEYTFGVDDAYYYSYIRSVVLDADFDLQNEYELSGLTKFQDEKTREARTGTGYRPNVYPVGLSIFWAPFFLFGHLLASISGLPQTGFSRVYTHAVGAGNLFYVCAGLYFCYRFCAQFFGRLLSLLCTVGLLLATPHLWLFFRSYVLISEPLSLSLIAVCLFLFYKLRDNPSAFKWFLAGLLLGATAMVRFHNGVVGIIPAFLLLRKLRKDRNSWLIPSACCFAGAMIGFFPQLVAWKMIYGEWFVSLGGDFLPFLKSPFVLETLFSARKGLFPWAPVTFVAFCGLPFFLKKDRIWALLMILVLLATIWINAAQADWWGATSLGSRRFVPMLVIFIFGLASLTSLLPTIARLALIVTVTGCIFLNLFFVSAFRSGEIQAEHSDRFSDLLSPPYLMYKPIAYALQFPVQLAYHLRYGMHLYGSLNEFFIGEDVFYFQNRAIDQVYASDSPLFGKGWIHENGVWKTQGNESLILVPMFTKDKPRFTIEFIFDVTELPRDVWIDFSMNGKDLRSRKLPNDGSPVVLPVRSRDYLNEVNLLSMHVYHSRQEAAAPQLVLKKIYFQAPRAMQFDEDEP